ncbi:MAG: ABC transporter permease subunit [Trueperaceae bacterium]
MNLRLPMLWAIMRKELLSTFRDRRTILSSLLIPLLALPILRIGLPLALGSFFERERSNTSDVPVLGLDALPTEFKALLEAEKLSLLPLKSSQSASKVVEEGDYAIALEIPKSFVADLEQNKATLIVYRKEGNVRSELTASKVENALNEFRTLLVGERLKVANLDVAILEPVRLENRDASSSAETNNGQLAWMIPFFMAVWALAGGQVAAIDATAGEKERGTLESLLISPVRRGEIVGGKFLATLSLGLLSSLMAITGYAASGLLLNVVFINQLGESGKAIVEVLGGSLVIAPGSLLILVLTALFLAALLAALLMSITMFARSFKEAQSYVAPLSFLFTIPAIGLQLADFFNQHAVIYLVPLFNALLLMNDTVKGRQELLPTLFTWLSLLIFTLIFLRFAYRSFNRENVLFRT